MKFIVYTNYFLSGGNVPDWQSESMACLKKALQIGALSGFHACAVVRVSDEDYSYFSEYFSDAPAVFVERLEAQSQGRRLPFLNDILSPSDKAHQFFDSFGAQPAKLLYVIYKNSDICLPGYFFEFIASQLAYYSRIIKGAESRSTENVSVIVNRKDIISRFLDDDFLGSSSRIRWHPGYDLFVFPAAILRKLSVDGVAVGNPPIGAVMALNLLVLADHVELISDILVTWHRGVDSGWKKSKKSPEAVRNLRASFRAVKKLFEDQGVDPKSLKTVGHEANLLRAIFRG